MRGSKRLGLAFTLVTLIALLAAGLFTQLGGGAGATSTTPDKLVYSQQNGAKGQYLQYVPGDGSKVTTQAVTGAGGCATPNTAAQPLLAFSAKNYPNGYSGASQSAIVGAYNSRTGVCATPQAWSIEVNEELIFAPGPNPLTNGRVFTSASLFLEREDKAGGTLTGQLLAKLNGQVQKTIPFSITTNANPIPSTETGLVAAGFNELDVRVLTPSAGSISVVGPTSTFVFANQICPGDSITDTSTGGTQTSGEVTATVTYVKDPNNPNQPCKAYTFFAASSTDGRSTDGKSVTFLSQPLGGSHININIDWGNIPFCRADATVDANVPPCPTTIVDFGLGEQPESYCAKATTALPYCSIFKQFTYVPDPADGTKTVVHEVETFDGINDIFNRH